MKKAKVYGLVPSNDQEDIKYIGATSKPLKTRLKGHRTKFKNPDSRNKNSELFLWGHNLYEKGLKPDIILVDEDVVDDIKFWEEHYINLFRCWGFNLLNSLVY